MEIFTIESGEVFPKATGVRLVELGLSYPLESPSPPPCYQQAWMQSNKGVHNPSLYGLAKCESLAPWQLKSLFSRSVSEIVREWSSDVARVKCRVHNSTMHLNEANLLVLKSLIPGAGLGLFLRPTPGHHSLVIPRDTRICLYSCRPLASEESIADLPTTDYLLEAQVGHTTHFYSPHEFTGEEMGRFVNQGGLIKGLEQLCMECDRRRGATSFSLHPVREVMGSSCNVAFSFQRNSLLVVARQDLLSSIDAQELLVDYGIDYWVRYVVEHLHRLDSNAPRVKYILWALLSEDSVYHSNRDLVENIPEDVIQRYAHMPCPVVLDHSRRSYH